MYKTVLIITFVVSVALSGGLVLAQETDKPVSEQDNTIDALLKKAIDEKAAAENAKDEKQGDSKLNKLDVKKADDKQASDKKSKDGDKPSSKPAKSTDDDELIRGLLPNLKLGGTEPSEGAGEDELERAISSMREAGRKINDGDVSDETQAIQKSILDDIDKLIEKLNNQPPPPKSNKNDNKNQQQNKNNQQNKQPQNQNPQPQQRQNKKPKNQPQTSEGGEQKSKAAESQEENQRKLQQARRAAARRRALINEVWGHLPPNVRERLLNVGGEKMLPKYEDRIRRYFESLAEGKKTKR